MDSASVVNIGGIIGLISYVIWQDWRAGKFTRSGVMDNKDVAADTRDALQPLMSRMDTLAQHFNHETSDLLTEIKEKQSSTCKKLDAVVNALDDIRVNGVRIKQ